LFFKKILKPAILITGKLSSKSKMVLLMVTISVLLVTFFIPIANNFFTQNRIYNKKLVGLSYVAHINRLITSVQMHRGAFNAHLAGHTNFMSEIQKAQINIDRRLEGLVRLNYQHSVLDKSEFDFFIKTLEDMRFDNIATQKSSGYVFAMHTNIIDELIDLLRSVSFETKLSMNSQYNLYAAGTALAVELPTLKEYTGQLRDRVVGHLTLETVSDAEKQELFSLLSHTRSHLEKNVVLDLLNYSDSKNEQIEEITHMIEEAIVKIKTSIISLESITFYTELFFYKITLIIERQVELEEILIKKYTQEMETLKEELLFRFVFILAIFAIVFVAFLYIFSALYLSILSGLKKLSNATKRVGDGELNIELEVDLEDEIGEALLAFNSMSHKLAENITFLDRYKIAVDETSIVSKTDKDGVITYVNKKFCDIYGYSEQELIGSSHNIVRHPDMPKIAFKELWSVIENKEIWRGVVKNISKYKKAYISETTILPIMDANSNILEYIAIRHDITELEKFKEEIKKHNVDLLTGLPNRNKLLEDFPFANRAGLVYLNIDNFSGLNQFYGTKIADSVLIELSSYLQKEARKLGCKVYRLRSDDFLLIFQEDGLPKEDYRKIVKELISRIESKEIECSHIDSITINVHAGVDIITKSTKIEKLLNNLDLARKTAKYENKKFLLYRANMENKENYKSNIKRISEIKQAIISDKIEVYFQPIIDNVSNKISKFEALVRLVRDDEEVLSPFFFLDVAIKANLYPQITQIVINKAFGRFEYLSQYGLSINLSIEDITNEDTVSFILNKLRSYPNTSRIVFEILESQEIEDYVLIAKFVKAVKNLGAKVAIDDFGTGYSNFDHIVNIDPDFIKIDGSLIRNINQNKNSQILVKSIIGLSKNLGIKTIAEFVHSKEIADIVKNMGADFSQGYYLGEPKNDLA